MFEPLKPFPPVLSGARVRIIAPANFAAESDFSAAKAALEGYGFKVEACPHLFDRLGQFAGSDEVRARSLEAAFTDKNVDVILCARGGYGSPRMIDLVDWAKVAAHPKPFIGYSDITAVLWVLLSRCRMPVFHGPMGKDLRAGDNANDAASLRGLVEALKGSHADWPGLTAHARVLAEGDITAPIVGGNLTMLGSIAGTDPKFSAGGAILLIEDIAEYIYRLDRVLVQLRRAGALEGVRGVILSDLIEVEDGNVPFGMSAEEMVLSHFPGVPVIAGFPAGHGPLKATLPMGVPVTLTARDSAVTLKLS